MANQTVVPLDAPGSEPAPKNALQDGLLRHLTTSGIFAVLTMVLLAIAYPQAYRWLASAATHSVGGSEH